GTNAAKAEGVGEAAERRGTGGRLMVCMSSHPPRAAALLRKGSRIAGRLSTDWFVVYVETPEEAPTRIDSESQRHLLGNIELARELGAEVGKVHAKDPVEGLLDFARSHNVGLLLVGRSNQPAWKQRLGLGMDQRLVRAATDLDVQVIALEEGAAEREAGP